MKYKEKLKKYKNSNFVHFEKNETFIKLSFRPLSNSRCHSFVVTVDLDKVINDFRCYTDLTEFCFNEFDYGEAFFVALKLILEKILREFNVNESGLKFEVLSDEL